MSLSEAGKRGTETPEWTRDLYSKNMLDALRWKLKAVSLLCTAAGEEFYTVQSIPSSGPKALRDGRYGSCQNNAHQQLQEEGSAVIPQAKEPSGVVPSWQGDLKGAWYADTRTRNPRLTLSFPYYKLSLHGQRVEKAGSAEKICVNPASSHKGI